MQQKRSHSSVVLRSSACFMQRACCMIGWPARRPYTTSVQCLRPKAILPRRKPGACMKGGKTFPKEFFEQLALQASNDAPDYLFQHYGYPTPLLGSLRCTLFGFERDLDGIRPNTICIYEWRFSHEHIEEVEVTHRVKHKCRNLCYRRRSLPRPPRQVRTAACVVSPSVNASHA